MEQPRLYIYGFTELTLYGSHVIQTISLPQTLLTSFLARTHSRNTHIAENDYCLAINSLRFLCPFISRTWYITKLQEVASHNRLLLALKSKVTWRGRWAWSAWWHHCFGTHTQCTLACNRSHGMHTMDSSASGLSYSCISLHLAVAQGKSTAHHTWPVEREWSCWHSLAQTITC